MAVKPPVRVTGTDPSAKLRSLLMIAAAIGASRRFSDVLELAAEEALRAMGAASLSISRWEREHGWLRTLINVGILGPGEERFPADEVYRLDEFPYAERMVRDGTCWVRSAGSPTPNNSEDILVRYGKESEAAVPIMVEGQVWGELYATTANGQPHLTEADTDFMKAVASHLAAGLASAEYLARLEDLAFTDPLTGLANRRGLEEYLDSALIEAELDRRPVSLVLCDLDGLKQLNDRSGHAAGDAALMAVATALAGAVAALPGGLAARIGGDEFCLALVGYDSATAQRVTRLALDMLSGEGTDEISVSAGIATAYAVHTTDDLFCAADEAQYEAKRQGPGSIFVADAGERVELATGNASFGNGNGAHDRRGRVRRRAAQELAATDIAQLLAHAGERAAPPDLIARVLAAAREHLDVALTFLPAHRLDGMGTADGQVTVPVTLRDGRLYGVFQCSRPGRHAVEPGEIRFLHLLSAVVAGAVDADADRVRDIRQTRERIAKLLDTGALRTVFQPVSDLRDGRVTGVEALTRFRTSVSRPPDVWFAEAAAVGLGIDLELAALRAALAQLPLLSEDLFLAVNLSADALCSPRLPTIVADHGSRLVLEITEHAPVEDYRKVHDALRVLRAAGARLAVDDAGAGYASLAHILRLDPDIIKLDLQLTRGIDGDPVRRALASALCTFADGIGASIIAEGIETAEEVAALRELGIVQGQGNHLGRPGPLPLPVTAPHAQAV